MESIPGVYLWSVLLGLCLGSFLNVVIHRLPLGRSLLKPGSFCPRCRASLTIRDKVPLLSYLLQGGRCRYCSDHISLRYPVVELLGAACVLAAGLTSATLAVALLRTVFLLAMVAVTVIDLESGVIPDEITLPGAVIGLVVCPWLEVTRMDAGIGLLAGAGGLLLLAGIYRAVRGVSGLGMGDVKLAGMLGAWLGWQGLLLTLIIGSVAGAVVGTALLAGGRGTPTTALPYGSFLAPAAILTVLYGPHMWNWYLGLSG
jgi:leader peptidase (prepilin peptidase)/N-methyltransferase